MISQGDTVLRSKRMYDFVIPAAIGVVITILSWRFNVKFGLFEDKGVIPNIASLLNLLAAFYIAALAAVATFDRKGLDDRMKGEVASLKRTNKRGSVVIIILTHRQFVCYLFGYLSLISIAMLSFIYFSKIIQVPIIEFISFSGDYWVYIKSLFVFLFFATFANLMITMLLGVHFLSDRLQFMDDPSV